MENADTLTPDIGIVEMGRNEGERLHGCFESLKHFNNPIIYVDSGSTDNNLYLARIYCKDDTRLDMNRPFSTAWARNTGQQRLLDLYTPPSYIHFIEGGYELEHCLISCALNSFTEDQALESVFSHMQEKHAVKSSSNKLCGLVWRGYAGKVDHNVFLQKRQ